MILVQVLGTFPRPNEIHELDEFEGDRVRCECGLELPRSSVGIYQATRGTRPTCEDCRAEA